MDSNQPISNYDMINCYNESFRGLGLFDTGCDINYNPPANITSDMHFLCYDLFEEVIEKTKFEMDMVFVNCMEDQNGVRFTVEFSNNENIYESVFEEFKKEELKKLGTKIKVYNNEESVLILLLFPNNKEVE